MSKYVSLYMNLIHLTRFRFTVHNSPSGGILIKIHSKNANSIYLAVDPTRNLVQNQDSDDNIRMLGRSGRIILPTRA